jgi:endonuclease/exonuclease/phosphatase family metal-dependent hydrolase
MCEVESSRAAELLQKALNDRLSDPALHYGHLLMKEVSSGRHIAPAILTRLPVVADRTRTHGSRLRILEGHIKLGDRELIVLASHWTSRINDGSDSGRAKYAKQLYGAANAMFRSDPGADVLICGDFNDGPDDASVTEHLHASGDGALVKKSKELRLFNLMAGKDPGKFGTHYYSGWIIFDQIVVSPGMLDGSGWSVDADSLQAVRTLTKPGDRIGRPWRFGGEKDKGPRGFSDHFPVTVKLRVGG